MDAKEFMIVKEIQYIFHQELDALYGKDEVDSFLNILLEYYLGLKRIDLVLNPDTSITKVEGEQLLEALNSLKQEEPIQYIIGETEFYGLKLKVTEHTLIPRPETEELVDWILKEIRNQKSEISILDIGTGSGCIAIALAKNLPNAKVVGLDVSEEALKLAKENALVNTVGVGFIHQDILSSCHAELNSVSKKFDVIVSNPPYVRQLEKSEIKNNVLKHEPHLALFVENEDPLIFYRAIAQFAVENLSKNGALFFEINQYLGRKMIQLLQELDFKAIELKKDLFGNDRMIKAINNKI